MKNPWVYLVIVNHCPFACYTVAWRVLVALRVLFLEGHDVNSFKVVRYRLQKDSSIDVEREVVTDSFLRSLSS